MIQSSHTYYYEDAQGDEIAVELEYCASPAVPGTMYDRYGDPGSPPEPAQLEIENLPECLESERDAIVLEIWETIQEQEAEQKEAAEEARYDAWREERTL